MSDQSNLDVGTRLEAIQQDVRELKSTINRLIVGENGDDGLIPRVTRHEERISSTRRALAWLTACFVALGAYVFGKLPNN